MELPTLTVTRDEAAHELTRYRRARRDGVIWTSEDQRMLDAYRAIAGGRTVIDLHRAMALGGVRRMEYRDGRWDSSKQATVTRELGVDVPVVAVARADRRFCWTIGVTRDGSVSLRTILEPHNEGRSRDIRRFDDLFAADPSRHVLPWRIFYRAIVPPVPPHLRPMRRKPCSAPGEKVQIDLGRFFVLWEAEWEIDRSVPPGDPALLRHLGGTLYAVEATWDLTPVEQAVVAGREPAGADLVGGRWLP